MLGLIRGAAVLPQRGRVLLAGRRPTGLTVRSLHRGASIVSRASPAFTPSVCRATALVAANRRGSAACVRASPLRTAVRRKTTESAEQGACARCLCACAAGTWLWLPSCGRHAGHTQLSLMIFVRMPQNRRLLWQP